MLFMSLTLSLIAWSILDEDTPIAYRSERSQCKRFDQAWSWPLADDCPVRFPYTNETYNNPQNLWIYAYVATAQHDCQS